MSEVKVKVGQLCPTPWDPMDYTVHAILQARILEWVAHNNPILLFSTCLLPLPYFLSPLATTGLFSTSVSLCLFCYIH